MKELITANTINDARKTGVKHINISPDAIITPQAKDDAKQYGIALIIQEKSVSHTPSTYVTQSPMQIATQPLQGNAVAYAQQHNRVAMNNPHSLNSPMDPSMQQIVEKVLQTLAPHSNNPWNANAYVPPTQNLDPRAITSQVLQQINSILANRGGMASFPNLESTIAQVVAEYTSAGAGQGAHSANTMQNVAPTPQPTACANVAGIDVVPFPAQQPQGRVQGEVNIEEALLPSKDGPGLTRFTFTDTSLVWTFTHDEALVVTHGNIEVQSANGSCMLGQGGAVRVANGTSVTLVAHGSASCVCVAWSQ